MRNDLFPNANTAKFLPSRWIRLIFVLTLFFSALTGFAQMPIFKRYYIADLPGLGWLAEYFVTYRLHYISAIIFMITAAFLAADWFLRNRGRLGITLFGYLRGAILFMILATGILLVYRNQPGYRFSPEFVVLLNFSHLGLVMLLIVTALAGVATRGKWVRLKR